MKIKKQKAQKSVVKNKLHFEDYKIFSKGTQLENKINNPEKNKVNIDSLREKHIAFIKNKISILKSQERFRSET